MNLSNEESEQVEAVEALLKLARGKGCSVCRILTHVCANHLFSDESDECHINGIEFGQQINELGAKNETFN